MKVELVTIDRAAEIVEKALKVRNPELAEVRRKNRAKHRRKQGQVTHEQDSLAAQGALGQLTEINREVSQARWNVYYDEMKAGRWMTSPDPIVVTEEGYLINGQHRLLAALVVEPPYLARYNGTMPQFLVVWGMDKKAALLMDEAARNTKDRRHIALGYARAS